MTVRELLIKLGFKVDESKIRRTDNQVEKYRKTALRAAQANNQLSLSLGRVVGGFVSLAGVVAGGRWLTATIADMDALKARMISVYGSTEIANQKFEEFLGFAAQTPFRMAEIADAAIDIKSLGFEASVDDLRMLGDLLSARGKDFRVLKESISSTLKKYDEGLLNFGVHAQFHGDKITVTFNGITEEIDNNTEAIIRYLQRIGQENYAGAVERQAKTLRGVWSTLQDNVAIFAYQIGEAGLKPALVELLNNMTALTTNGVSVAKTLGQVLGPTVRGLMFVLQLLARHAKTAGIALAAMIAPVIAPMIASLVTTMLPLLLAFLAIEDFVNFLQGKDSLVGRFVDKWKGDPSFLGKLADGMAYMRDQFPQDLTMLKNDFQRFYDDVSAIFSDLGIELPQTWEETWDDIKKIFEFFWENFGPGLLDKFIEFPSKFSEAWAEESAAWDRDMQKISGFFREAWAEESAAWDRDMQKISGFFDKVVEHIKQAWIGLFAWLESTLNSAVDMVNDLIGAAQNVGVDIDKLNQISFNGEATEYRSRGGGITDGMWFAGGGRRALEQSSSVNTNVGEVHVHVDGTTNMGPGEVAGATEKGMDRWRDKEYRYVNRVWLAGEK